MSLQPQTMFDEWWWVGTWRAKPKPFVDDAQMRNGVGPASRRCCPPGRWVVVTRGGGAEGDMKPLMGWTESPNGPVGGLMHGIHGTAASTTAGRGLGCLAVIVAPLHPSYPHSTGPYGAHPRLGRGEIWGGRGWVRARACLWHARQDSLARRRATGSYGTQRLVWGHAHTQALNARAQQSHP